MPTYYKWISICPVEDCYDYDYSPSTWTINKCGGTSYLGDNGMFVCGHMVSGTQKVYSCSRGTTEFAFFSSGFSCERHGDIYKRVERPETIVAAMHAVAEMISSTRPDGVDSQVFRRWLRATTASILKQYT